MAIYKLNIENFDEIDFRLIAIHSDLEDYRLAYFINKNLNLQLIKKNDGVNVIQKKSIGKVSKFEFTDNDKSIEWCLLSNKAYVENENKITTNDLFYLITEEINITYLYLLPELMKVNYFLKITDESNFYGINEIVFKIKNIIGIVTAYEVVTTNLKNSNNLIF